MRADRFDVFDSLRCPMTVKLSMRVPQSIARQISMPPCFCRVCYAVVPAFVARRLCPATPSRREEEVTINPSRVCICVQPVSSMAKELVVSVRPNVGALFLRACVREVEAAVRADRFDVFDSLRCPMTVKPSMRVPQSIARQISMPPCFCRVCYAVVPAFVAPTRPTRLARDDVSAQLPHREEKKK